MPPPSTPLSTFGLSPKYRSPSYYRRQARRRACRESQDNGGMNLCSPAADQACGSKTCKDNTEISNAEDVDVAEEASCVIDSSAKSESCSGEVVNSSSEDFTEEVEVDKDELARDKIIEEILVYSVGGIGPEEKKDVVEQEIVQKLANIGVIVKSMKSFSKFNGNFDQSRVKTSPVNLKDIWGRRLGMMKCAVIEYYPPPSH